MYTNAKQEKGWLIPRINSRSQRMWTLLRWSCYMGIVCSTLWLCLGPSWIMEIQDYGTVTTDLNYPCEVITSSWTLFILDGTVEIDQAKDSSLCPFSGYLRVTDSNVEFSSANTRWCKWRQIMQLPLYDKAHL